MSEPHNTNGAASKTPARLRATLILACLGQFMVILDVSVVNVALPAIRHGLGFSEQDLQWVVNACSGAVASSWAASSCSRWPRSPAASPRARRC
jgi:hypothetical protein